MAGEDVGAAAAGQGGQAFGAGLGLALHAGENRKPVNAFYDPYAETDASRQTGYNPQATNYNGSPRGLQDYTANNEYKRNQVVQRGPALANYANADVDRLNAGGARTGQQTAANLFLSRATGNQPTFAEQSGKTAMDNAAATQGGLKASARGAAGLALAGQVAAGNTANTQAQIGSGVAVAAGQERLADLGAANNAFTGLRAGDLQSQGQNAQQSQFQATQTQAATNQNDQVAMGYEKLNADAQAQQLAAKTQEQGSLASSYGQQQQQQNQTNNQNAQTQQSWWQKLLSDERTKVCLGKGGGKMWSDEKTKEVIGLAPGTKIIDPSTHPVDSLGFSHDSDDDFKDPGASNPMGAMKAHSDYATRFVHDPGATSFYSDQNTKYDTKLSPEEEKQFQVWFAKNAPRGDRGSDYDYRGAWKAGLSRNLANDEHFPDTFKKPNHKTFSGESQNAKGADLYKAGAWQGDKFIPPSKPGSTKGVALSRGGADGAPVTGDPNAPHMFFDPMRGWQMPHESAAPAQDEIGRAALHRAIEARAKEDEDNLSIDQGLEEQRARDERMQRDAVVAPGQAPHGYAARRAKEMGYDPTQSSAPEDTQGLTLAPGTADFNRTEPKPAGPAYATSDSDGVISDDRTKLVAAFTQGMAAQRASSAGKAVPAPDYMSEAWAAKKKAPAPAAAASAPLTRGTDIGAREVERGRPADMPQMGMPKDREGNLIERGMDSSPIADANRAMVGQPYAYKPGFAEASGQRQGEVNVGPMAQRMEKSPVAGTAVKTDPATGLKTIDKDKALKVVMSGVADLQRQNDELRGDLVLQKGGRK